MLDQTPRQPVADARLSVGRIQQDGSIRTDFIWRASSVLLLATGYRQIDANSF